MFQKGGPSFFELLDQGLSGMTEGYDKLAPKFDKTPFRTPDDVLETFARRVAKKPIRAALDLCCGTGAAMQHLRPYCDERVVGLDLSRGMLDVAERTLRATPGNVPFELVQGDALALPRTFDGAFDLVTSTGAFGHIEERDEHRFLVEIRRSLAKGGRFAFVTGRPPKPTSPWFWLAHGFNAAMHVRNAVRSPKFVMIYLTFLWPAVQKKLERAGFTVEVEHGLFTKPYERAVYVEATRRE